MLGFIFGVVQMALYFMYRNAKKLIQEAAEPAAAAAGNGNKLHELTEQIIDVVKLSAIMCPDLDPVLKDITAAVHGEDHHHDGRSQAHQEEATAKEIACAENNDDSPRQDADTAEVVLQVIA